MQTIESQRLWIYTIGRRVPVFVVFAAVVFLTGIGLLMLLSIGRAYDLGLGGFFFKQCVWLVVACIAFVVAASVDIERVQKFGWLIALFCVALLLLVLVPGIGLKINGARRWLDLGPMNLQVSDVAKIGYLMLLAQYLATVQRQGHRFLKGFLYPALIIGVFFFLILMQPDFGTAFLFALVGGILLFLAGASMRYLVPTLLLGISLFALAIWQDPIRLRRILVFLDVEANRMDGTYQLWQGIVGFAMGGINGVGLGNSRQQFAFLPEAHTDFIFPIIGEELGLIFTLLVVAVFAVSFLVTWSQLTKAPNAFSFLFVAGALLFIMLQALINMGVSTGVLPTKGMSLPLISYGGSNLVVTYFMFGIICRALWCWNNPPKLKPRDLEI